MKLHSKYKSTNRLTFSVFLWILFYTSGTGQVNSLTMDSLLAGRNKIYLHDPQYITPISFDYVLTDAEIESMYPSVEINRRLRNISSIKSSLTIQLLTNEDVVQPAPVRKLERLKIKVKYLSMDGTVDSLFQNLQIEYNNEPYETYVFYHSVKIDSALFAYIEVDSIIYAGGSHSPFNFGHTVSGGDTIGELNSITPFTLIARLEPIHTYGLTTEIPSNGLSSACNVKCHYNEATGDIEVGWKAAPEAASYTELEWTFTNTYPGSPPTYDFRMNNTAVQISSTDGYSLPMIFEKGVLIFRIRWVSLRGNDHRPVYSVWSLPENGLLSDVSCGKFEVTTDLIHEGDKMNWQYIATYAEEGKHKAVVTYYDGTMRSRQAVTRLSQSNTVIVGETIYDFQGRPAIQVLPVPVGLMDFPSRTSPPVTGSDIAPGPTSHTSWRIATEAIILENLGLLGTGGAPSSTSTASTEIVPDVPGQYLPQTIQYYKNFNLNGDGSEDPYSWTDFDTGTLCDTSVHAAPMTNSKGASRYYSTNNDDQTGFNANIPNANGYPFIQTEYTPDNTGRVSRKGNTGETFQLRRGHDTRYYYGVPSQDELDRLFGSDAGLAAYYKKNMVMDGNGQLAVQYVDMTGKVVASGLAGASPGNLDSLENKWKFRDTMDLFGADVRFQNELNNTLRSTTRLLVQQNGTLVTFKYDLPAKQFPKDFCPGKNFCLDCEYDYNIQVVDECGVIRWSASQNRVGASKRLDTICDLVNPPNAETAITLDRGVYSVSRTLTVSRESIEEYGRLYDTTMICPQTKDSFLLAGNLNFPPGGCNLTCENCKDETYAGRQAGDIVLNTLNRISMPYKITQSDIDRDSLHCLNLCKKTSSKQENILGMMLRDVSTNGMYGEIYQHFPDDTVTLTDNEERDSINPTVFPLSVFNSFNRLGEGHRNWKYPSRNKFNPDGTKYYERDSSGTLVESWVTIPRDREMGYQVLRPALPPEKSRRVNGRLQIKPEALIDVREFIQAWKEEWAYALLPYHPEYPTLLWYMRNTASNDYDEKLNNIQSYQDAEAYVNGLTDVNRNDPEILNRDVYFSERSAARTKIKNLLFGSRDGYDRHPLEILALSSAYCAIEDLLPADLPECLDSTIMYERPGMKDAEWQFVRALYMQYKHHIQDSLRSTELITITDDQYSNGSLGPIVYPNPSALNIGDSSTRASNLYWNKVMRLPTQDDIMKNMIGCPQLERMIGTSRFMAPDITCMREKAEGIMKKECNKCPVARELETLLALLASTNKLTARSTENMIGRIINTSGMITPLGSSGVRRATWSPVVSDNELVISIQAQLGFSGSGTIYDQFIKIKSFDTDIQWNKVRMIRCLNYAATPELYPLQSGKNFSLRGIYENGKEFLLEGITSCYNLDTCKSININMASKEFPKGQSGNDNMALGSNKYDSCCPEIPAPAPSPVKDCEKNRQNLISFFYDQNLQNKVEQERIELRKEYTDACLQNADAFKAILDNSIYQLTLYYYDQAGNLVKTVPPAGVDTFSRERIRNVQINRRGNRNQIIVPDHRLVSSYKYNTLNQVIGKRSPDEGLVQLMYDSLGRVHLSQDAVQATIRDGREKAYSYILFDKLGRISESGQAYLDTTRVRSGSGSHTAVRNMVRSARKQEVVQMYYDKPLNSTTNMYFTDGGQQLLRNRVSSTVFTENVVDPSTFITSTGDILHYNNATHYSYDYHGNVKTLIQENRDEILMRRGQSRKRIDYDFDLISGKTSSVCYQCDSTDQFIHRYAYDADNRITDVNTGTQSERLQHDAKYIFYKHGPVARIDLGDRLVQGIDYAYTLQGWLKGINSNTSNPRNDMGGDGGTGSPFARDRYGFSLNYFTNDYSPIATRAASFLASPGSTLTRHLEEKGLFSGNIASTASTINDVSGPGALLHLYTYDQLQRIKTSNSYAILNTEANAWGSASAGLSSHGTSYSYDPNGNITRLNRAAGATQYDNLNYRYPVTAGRLQNNKLVTVTENASHHSVPDAGDISANINYIYDDNGNITRENGTESRWTATGRIKQYGDQHYAYDASQRRLKKTDSNSTQFYVYDPTGNILALYNFRNDSLFWTGSPIYGASRLGMYHANEHLPPIRTGRMDILRRGKTEYELTNHLGDVIATITDKKLTRTDVSSTFSSDIIAAQEYLPFGMQMPGRTYASTTDGYVENYPFGYNGMEQDKKDGADGYTTEFRQYDSRIGRWMAIDPKSQKYPSDSPFSFGNNNPALFVDSEGGHPERCNFWRQSVGVAAVHTIGGFNASFSTYQAICPSGVEFGYTYELNVEGGAGEHASLDVGVEVFYGSATELENANDIHIEVGWGIDIGIDIPIVNGLPRGLSASVGFGEGVKFTMDVPDVGITRVVPLLSITNDGIVHSGGLPQIRLPAQSPPPSPHLSLHRSTQTSTSPATSAPPAPPASRTNQTQAESGHTATAPSVELLPTTSRLGPLSSREEPWERAAIYYREDQERMPRERQVSEVRPSQPPR